MNINEAISLHEDFKKYTRLYDDLTEKYEFYLTEYNKIKHIDCPAAHKLKEKICTMSTERINFLEKYKDIEKILKENLNNGDDYAILKFSMYDIGFLSEADITLLDEAKRDVRTISYDNLKIAQKLLNNNYAAQSMYVFGKYHDVISKVDSRISELEKPKSKKWFR